MTSSANRNVILFNTTVQKLCESLLAVVLQSEATTPEADGMINRTLRSSCSKKKEKLVSLLIKRANSSGFLNIPSDEKTERITACDVIIFTEEAGLSQPIRRVHHNQFTVHAF